MSGGMAHRIETGIDAAAAALLGGAVFFAASRLGFTLVQLLIPAAFAFSLSFWLLGRVGRGGPGLALPEFAPVQFDPAELAPGDGDPDLTEQAGVVRLFNPSAAFPAAPPDASQALYDALAKLRRSLL